MLSLMLQEIVSDQVSVFVNVCVFVWGEGGHSGRHGKNKVMIRTARNGLMSQANEKETRKKGKDHTDEGRG